MIHHPFITLLLLYYAGVAAIVVQFNTGLILIATIPLITAVFTYYSAKRERRLIRREVAETTQATNEVKGKVEEVHVLVGGQKEELEAELAKRDERIAALEQMLAAK